MMLTPEHLVEVTHNNYCERCSQFRYAAYHNPEITLKTLHRFPYICPTCRGVLRDPAEVGVLTPAEEVKVALLREALEDAERQVESIKQRIIDIAGRV